MSARKDPYQTVVYFYLDPWQEGTIEEKLDPKEVDRLLHFHHQDNRGHRAVGHVTERPGGYKEFWGERCHE